MNKYRIHGYLRGTLDKSRDGGWLGTIEAESTTDALKRARKSVPKRWVVDSAERVWEPPFKAAWQSDFAPYGILNEKENAKAKKKGGER